MTSSKSSNSVEAQDTTSSIKIDPGTVNNKFCLQKATTSLNVTCYGSSSAKTPIRYLEEARSLGYMLARRGHICINGAGSYGCMAAMNDGVLAGDGHVRGVIHEMFLVDNGYVGINGKKLLRRGSSHQVFENAIIFQNKDHVANDDKCVDDNTTTDYAEKGLIREIHVAGGDDLQERKKFLVNNTDAVIVLPGGPGTWDELWEMACARHLNLNQLPIVCVNIDDYYEPFRDMLDRAYYDELIRLPPHEIVHFASSAEEAIRFVEEHDGKEVNDADKKQYTNKQYIRKCNSPWSNLALAFVTGAAFGVVIAISLIRR